MLSPARSLPLSFRRFRRRISRHDRNYFSLPLWSHGSSPSSSSCLHLCFKHGDLGIARAQCPTQQTAAPESCSHSFNRGSISSPSCPSQQRDIQTPKLPRFLLSLWEPKTLLCHLQALILMGIFPSLWPQCPVALLRILRHPSLTGLQEMSITTIHLVIGSFRLQNGASLPTE